ncbi:MAG: PaaI family thioesterase [Deltaproteobacteria bacterium]|nr:PaaI family thioesterase [Deltaproteobacteria bacterium]MBW1910092.1 PaaI family thioesterase [Deltaproteobacteria bacterium]MBW2034545.1 PaaI family thioesterase [Deltaproteobacteria bacterium]MBW2114802.1 PaaI family thioesterase [Deltaproteobacteria bacterium]MBW2168872.1 PaaI family thioesterase [Deltaproteobacteria bacterium]
MKKLNPAHVAAIAKTVNTCPYFTLLSMEIRSLDWGESRLEVTIQEKHLQPYGMVHGGVCASLADAAIYWAVYSGMEETVGLTTVEIKLNYLAPVSAGRLIAKGKCIKVGKSICLGEASVEDDKGNLVAHGTSTMMVLDSLKIQDQSQVPPKFID